LDAEDVPDTEIRHYTDTPLRFKEKLYLTYNVENQVDNETPGNNLKEIRKLVTVIDDHNDDSH